MNSIDSRSYIRIRGNFVWSLQQTTMATAAAVAVAHNQRMCYELPHSHEHTFNLMYYILPHTHIYVWCSFWPNRFGHNFHCIAKFNITFHFALHWIQMCWQIDLFLCICIICGMLQLHTAHNWIWWYFICNGSKRLWLTRLEDKWKRVKRKLYSQFM